MRRQKRAFLPRLAVTGAAVLLLGSGLTAGATEGYEPADKGRLIVVGEPDNMSSHVEYCRGETILDPATIPWVDGGVFGGKAVQLKGGGDYLRLWRNQLKMNTMTFSGWINWRGLTEGLPEETLYQQHFFSFSSRDKYWLTFLPHSRGEEPDENGLIRDGVLTQFYRPDAVTHQEKLCLDGVESKALPQNDWHHVALVMDGQTLTTYIDGEIWVQESMLVHFIEMEPRYFTLGGTLDPWGDTTLNALVDEVYLYNFALDADQIRLLNAGLDPMDPEAVLPEPAAPYLPTKPAATTTSSSAGGQTYMSLVHGGGGFLTETVFGLPKLTVLLVGGLLALFLVLCVVVNAYHYVRDRRETPPEPRNGTEGDER